MVRGEENVIEKEMCEMIWKGEIMKFQARKGEIQRCSIKLHHGVQQMKIYQGRACFGLSLPALFTSLMTGAR